MIFLYSLQIVEIKIQFIVYVFFSDIDKIKNSLVMSSIKCYQLCLVHVLDFAVSCKISFVLAVFDFIRFTKDFL